MGNNKFDREDAETLRRWEERKEELRAMVVDTRKLARAQINALGDNYRQVDPGILFPSDQWGQLKFHEKRWLEVEAAAMTCRGGILVGRSAARKYGMWVVSRTRETVEVGLPSRSNSPSRRRSGAYTFRYSALAKSDVLSFEGQLATTPIRTFIDIARYHGFVEGLIAADYLLRRGKSRAEIETAVQRMRRCKGIATVRRCLEHAIATSQSPYESLARALLIDAGLTSIVAQFEIDGRYVDLCIDGWLLIEIDGDMKYDGPDGEQAWRDEMKRQKRIGNKGYRFLRYPPEFIRDDPERFVNEVKEALESRDLLHARIG